MEQYGKALTHISVRVGTDIPTGAAEDALAFLYRHGRQTWPFLTRCLAGATEEATPLSQQSQRDDRSQQLPALARTGTASPTDEGKRRETSGAGKQQHRDRGKKEEPSSSMPGEVTESYSLPQLSAALEALVCELHAQGCAPEGLAIKALANFLYLGGQTKVRLRTVEIEACEEYHSSGTATRTDITAVNILVYPRWGRCFISSLNMSGQTASVSYAGMATNRRGFGSE